MNRQRLKERLKNLTPEQREKFKEYTDALKEIKKELKELLNKGQMQEIGGPIGVDSMHLNTSEE